MKQTESQRIRTASRYLRAIRGKGLSANESPIKLAVRMLCEFSKAQPIQVAEKNVDYLDKNRKLMLDTIKANKDKIPKKSKAAKHDFLESYAWRKLRMEALIKYGPRCMCCGATPKNGAVMNVDHIKPRQTHPELALNLDNLQILCHECNHGKGNWDKTDWRNSQ